MLKIYKNWLPTIMITMVHLGTLLSQTIPIEIFDRDKLQEANWNSYRSNQQIRVIQYDPAAYETLKNKNPDFVSMNVPAPGGDLILNLKKNEFLADGFKITNDKNETISPPQGLFYKGEIDGQPGSFAAISFFDHEVVAVINTLSNNRYVIGQSSSFRRESFVVYDAELAEAPPTDCMSESLPGYIEKSNIINLPTLERREAGGCVNVYFELGSSVYNTKGGSAGAVNFITGVFNVVSALYTQDGINVKISEIFVWTTPEPYNDNSSTALTEFGRAKQLNFNGNIAQLVRIKSSGSQSGVAWLATLCSPYIASAGAGPYSYAEVLASYDGFPTYSWTTEVITHEIGHNLGSPHTQSCSWPGGPIDNCRTPEGNCSPGPTPTNGGTIMSYCHLTGVGINFNNGFGPQPKALILKSILNASCITACNAIAPPNPVCTQPGGLTASNLSPTGVTLSWSVVSGASTYAINYKVASSTSWTTLTDKSTALAINVTSLSSSTLYHWQVRANCGATNSTFAQSEFTTAAALIDCSGTPPTGLTSVNITTNAATIRWGSVSRASSYQVQYKKSGANVWSNVSGSLAASTFDLTNLAQATTYQWQVAANCNGGNSAFVSSQFTTSSILNCTTSPPTGLNTSAITTSGALLSWSPSALATSYSIDYKLSNVSVWSSLVSGYVGTSYSTEGLSPGISYDWRIKANCTAGSSTYSLSNFVTTQITACNPPSNLNTTNITQTSANLSWVASSGAFNYSIEYKKATAPTWIALTNTSSTSLNISGFVAGTVYDWRVRTNCSSGVSVWSQSQFSTGGSVAPPPIVVCNAPTSLAVSNISTAGATLSWSADALPIGFQLEYKIATSSAWTVADVALKTKSYILEKLMANTSYDWRVRSNCNFGNSQYTSAVFSTLPVVSECPGTKDLIENETFSTAQSIPMNEDILGKISPANDNDFYQFIVNIGGALTISLTDLPSDYDLRVYSSQGAIMGISQKSNLASESINLNLISGVYYARVYGWNSSSNSQNCYTLRITPTSAGIENNTLPVKFDDWMVTVSPNPAHDQLSLMVDNMSGTAITNIVDLQGKQHKKITVHGGLNRLDVGDLPSGFYLMKIENDTQNYKVLKFLKVN